MTDKQLQDDLAAAVVTDAERQLQQLLDRSAATALHAAALMARNAWAEYFNRFSEVTKHADADDVCREIARQLTELNAMVDRANALTGDNK